MNRRCSQFFIVNYFLIPLLDLSGESNQSISIHPSLALMIAFGKYQSTVCSLTLMLIKATMSFNYSKMVRRDYGLSPFYSLKKE